MNYNSKVITGMIPPAYNILSQAVIKIHRNLEVLLTAHDERHVQAVHGALTA